LARATPAEEADRPTFLTRGQPHALAAVRAYIRHESPPHALMLVGPAHVGKRTLAIDLACGLLCRAASAASRPCRRCTACRKVAHGNHPDLHRLAPEGAGDQIRLGQVQRLVADLALLPLEGRFRVAIVDAAHRLNPDAQNALLKTLEEPPAGVCLVLAADDAAALLPTVVSRCARLRLGPVPARDIAALLAEGGRADAARAASLARLSAGRPGLALALAASPETTVVHARIGRSLLDLLGADRRTRLGAAAELVADGTALDAALRGGIALAGAGEELPAEGGGTPEDVDRAAGGGDAGTRRSGPSRATTKPGARASPGERRRAVACVIDVWREVARDLAVAARGGRRELRAVEMLEEFEVAARGVDPSHVIAFLARLDALGSAIEVYANPELALDALLLAWPQPAAA
jgi:DNA polymerase-3 subunit delta'